ncbi:MAG: ATP-grasp domain-containing protein [Betaproteobacteria bacterium]|nr:MAG: ATP-grasp domain-containing protein [Betaproteobacteria bacterium]
MFKKILIANRGEIACRIARTCRRIGVATAGVHSSADRDALHVELIGESIEIGGAAAAESYLRIDAVIDAARRTGAQAIHPGFGFLAENAAFARAVEAAGLVFIGPTPEVIERLGDKAAAKREARAAGVAVLGGSDVPSRDAAEVAAIVHGLQLPVMLKAAAGGGGKGMRVVQQLDGLSEEIESAMREAKSAFGDPALIVEAFVDRGRHIEVQIAGDGRGELVHLFERECTLQRRHQKVIEEAPAANLSAALRQGMLNDAVRLGQRLRYRGLGTVEFIVQGERHHFLEVNPRLQVEHPVTEEVTGLDLVEIMVRIAAGEGLPLRQGDVRVRGCAVEARVCAEDTEHNFLPSTGELVEVRFPASGVRVESGVRAGMVVTPYYDSMLAKLIVHAPTRAAALDRLSLALGETRVLGVETNCVFLQRLLALPETRSATFHTRLIDQVLAERAPGAPGAPVERLAAAAAWWLLDARRTGTRFGAWSALDVTGWRMHAGDDPLTQIPALLLHSGGRVHEVRFGAVSPESEVTVQVGAERVRLSLTAVAQGDWRLRVGDRHDMVTIVRRGDTLFVQGGGAAHDIGVSSYLSHAATSRQVSGQLRTPMMGMILKTHVAVGERVRAGDLVATMESMKMELRISAEHDGVVRSLSVQAGQMVERGLVVAVVESENADESARA